MKIQDKLLGKYEIHITSDNHTVCYKNGVDKKGKDIYTNLYYCSNLPNALKRIAILLANENTNVTTLKDYIKKLTSITNKLLDLH